MATAAVTPFISVEDYLRMTFEYGAEYVDGRSKTFVDAS